MLVVGLGNHGLLSTRHSIGMVVVNALAQNLGISWRYERKCLGFVAETAHSGNKKLFLLKPSVPMNINGKSVLRTVLQFGIDHNNIYLIHDDLDKAVGKISVKTEGSAGGHNGVKSVISSLRSDKIKRFRFGIDRPAKKSKDSIVKYVLEEFSNEEGPLVSNSIEKCLLLINDQLKEVLSEFREGEKDFADRQAPYPQDTSNTSVT